jgi:hypothetical protein
MKRTYTDEELQRPEMWEEEGGRLPARPLVAIVHSVRFGREEMRLVRAAAERLHKHTSEFIREAAVDKALASFGSFGAIGLGGGTTFSAELGGTRNDGPPLKVGQ